MIGIMQPYFFPYIGYFQLINAVDTYVNLDHVSFMKRSYMTRNTLKNNIKINVPVIKSSQNKSCLEVIANVTGEHNDEWFNKFYKTLEFNYKKEPYYNEVMEYRIKPWRKSIHHTYSFFNDPINISLFNFNAIILICNYLDIKTKLITTSYNLTDKKFDQGLQEIAKNFNENHYVNNIGGQSLYNKEDFILNNIELSFIKTDTLNFSDPYLSILDILCRYDKSYIKTELNKYTLI